MPEPLELVEVGTLPEKLLAHCSLGCAPTSTPHQTRFSWLLCSGGDEGLLLSSYWTWVRVVILQKSPTERASLVRAQIGDRILLFEGFLCANLCPRGLGADRASFRFHFPAPVICQTLC